MKNIIDKALSLHSTIAHDVFPKRAKYIRRATRIYSIMDFKDGEPLAYYGSALSPSSDAEGYRYYKGESDIRLVHRRDIIECEEVVE